MPPRLRKGSEKAEALSLNDMLLSGSDEEEAQDEQHELESCVCLLRGEVHRTESATRPF